MWTSRAWNNTLSLSLFFFLLLKPFALHLIYFSWAKIGLILNMGLWLSQHASIWRVFSSLAGFIECSGLPLLVLPNLHLTLFPVLPTLNLYPLTSWTYITGRRNVSMTCPECWPILAWVGLAGGGGGACQAVQEWCWLSVVVSGSHPGCVLITDLTWRHHLC